jgi:DNA mismatch repair protein MutS
MPRRPASASLKIKHNNVLGYFIETTATHAEKMLAPPLSETFVHRQTTANQVRFTTLKLSEMETKILNAGARALEIEKRLFEELRATVLAPPPRDLRHRPRAGRARPFAAFAELARAATGRAAGRRQPRLRVEGGRHPVVERALTAPASPSSPTMPTSRPRATARRSGW